MYVVPNQPLQAVPKEVNLNQVNLAGGIGYINDPKMEELFECSIMVKAPSNKLLNHSWQTSMGFRLEGWQEDARRMRQLFYKGRQVAVGGSLRYSSWQSEDGVQKGYYSIRVQVSTVFRLREKSTEGGGANTSGNVYPESALRCNRISHPVRWKPMTVCPSDQLIKSKPLPQIEKSF